MKCLYKLIILAKVNSFLLSVAMSTQGPFIAQGFFLNSCSSTSSIYSVTTLASLTGRIGTDFFFLLQQREKQFCLH